ncbi:hypothetical protein [Anabaena azotica]|uniref:Transposase n=1 Tax=Anabaena azotica FACHB-119 TaxID=947527 RepID=A0ABR8D3V6_9NOST|nr:hypothetical protein [Anabaena azotica]MBD2501118.1 hypothetical protein [Anabaena azotica FACHB-119]
MLKGYGGFKSAYLPLREQPVASAANFFVASVANRKLRDRILTAIA